MLLDSIYRKMILKKYTLILALLLFITEVSGQQNYDLPKVISPSPQSQAMTRYGDYPMADYTGLTNITIPIYNITGRKLTMPISISFHASGRLANEPNGILGMRWTLNCGGLVSRTVKGLPDEWNRITSHTVNQNETPDFDLLYRSCPNGKINNLSQSQSVPYYDTEFDVFNYVLPNGKSGHFILKNVDGGKTPMVIPFEPLKIEFSKEQTSEGFIESITITDADGTIYKFGKIDSQSANAVEKKGDIILIEGEYTGQVPTAWYLSKIVTSDGIDEISLNYSSSIVHSSYALQSAHIGDRLRNSSSIFSVDNCTDDIKDPYECNLRDQYFQYYFKQTEALTELNDLVNTVPTLTNVSFSGGSVSLNYINAPLSVTAFNRTLLTGMVISGTNGTIKRIQFESSKHAGETDIYYLDDLLFFGEDSVSAAEKYMFDYYELENGTIDDFISSSVHKDWWGYNNHIVSEPLTHQTADISANGYIGPPVSVEMGTLATRDANEFDDKKIGMLKTITYPTGGETEFIYEGNRYDNIPYYQGGQNSSTLEGPGIRIKEVISKPFNGKNIDKVYKYGMYEDGRGYINEILRPNSTSFSNLSATENNEMHFWEWANAEAPIVYHPEQAGFRIRDYTCDPYIQFNLPGSPIKYDAVSEYYVEDGILKQKTQNRYSWGDNEAVNDFNVTDHDEQIQYNRKYSDPQNAWLTPVLTQKVYYKYSNGQFDSIQKESYEYVQEEKDEAWDMPTYLHTNIIYSRTNGTGQINPVTQYNVSKQYHNDNCNVYGYGYRKYQTGSQLISRVVSEEFSSTGTIRTEKQIEYNDKDFVKSEVVTNSKGETIRHDFKYPQDFVSQQPYTDMVNVKHILSPSLEQTKSKIVGITTTFLNAIKTNYNFWNGSAWTTSSTNQILPQTVDTRNFNQSDYETRLRYHIYDNKGNPITISKENDIKVSYIWDYQNQYPIAEVKNASLENIAYTSFESDGKGNWTFTGTPVNGGITGKKSYDPVSGVLTKTVSTAGNYIVSYWSKNGQRTVNGTTATIGRNVNGWTYYEHKVTLSANGTVSVAGSGVIDELRLYPETAEMNTYTYEPLIGMTGQCDANNRIAYYLYDNFGRLQQVKDQDGKLLKEICYNYAGQPENCTVDVSPGWTATGNLRCQTSGGNNTGYQEREEIDINQNSTTYNQTRWVTNGYNTTACPLPSQNCSFSMATGFSSPSNNITNNGTTVSFYMVIVPTNASMQPGYSYYVATINGSCRPSGTRTINYSSGGRNWTITIIPSGGVYWYLNPGSPYLPQYSGVGTSTLAYNL